MTQPVDAITRGDRAILRVAAIGAGVVLLVTLAVALYTGDMTELWRSGITAAIGLFAVWLLKTGRSAIPILYASGAAVIGMIVVMQRQEVVWNATMAVIGIAMAGSLLAKHRSIVFVQAAITLIVIALMRYRFLDDSLAVTVTGAVVPMVVVFFGSQIIEWTKYEITGRQSRYENLFDHVPVAIWEEDFSKVAAWLEQLRALGVRDLRDYLSTNPDTVRYGASLIEVLDVNDETLRFLEAPDRESVLGPLNPDLIVENSLGALIEEIMAVWEGRPKLRIELSGANLEGGQIEGYLLMVAPRTLLGIDWSRVVIAMVDVSEQLAAQRRLQELVDSKDRFVASVSHELRTPLTTVIGLAEELRHQNTTIGPRERDELLELIGDQAMEVGNLVEDLLVAAQATIGRINVLPQPISLKSELADLVGLLDLPNPPSIDVVGDIRPFADPRRFRQIMRNLISNAFRYGGDIILISARREQETMVLEVRDNGDGIPEELQERIFEPYESAHKVAGLTESVGLGLTVSRELARLMGGELTYYRTGGTTVFQLVLPAAEEAATVSEAARTAV